VKLRARQHFPVLGGEGGLEGRERWRRDSGGDVGEIAEERKGRKR
jgi:hypothetical protein